MANAISPFLNFVETGDKNRSSDPLPPSIFSGNFSVDVELGYKQQCTYTPTAIYTEQGFSTLFSISVAFQVIRGHFDINILNSLDFQQQFFQNEPLTHSPLNFQSCKNCEFTRTSDVIPYDVLSNRKVMWLQNFANLRVRQYVCMEKVCKTQMSNPNILNIFERFKFQSLVRKPRVFEH